MPLSRGWSKSGSRNRQRIPGSEWSQKWTWASVNGSLSGERSPPGRPGVNVIGIANVPYVTPIVSARTSRE